MSVFASIAAEFKKIFGWLNSQKVQVAIEKMAKVALKAAPIVDEISKLVPNPTFQAVVAAYDKYAVPFEQKETTDPILLGNYLLNLASSVVGKKLTAAGMSETTLALNSGVQMALTALRAGK